MALKLDKKIKDKIFLGIILGIILGIFITFAIFDLQISKKIPKWMDENWFSIIFDVFGKVVTTLPIYFLLFISFLIISFKYIPKKNWKIFWYVFFQVFSVLMIMVTYFGSDLLLKKDNPTYVDDVELISSIIYFLLTILIIAYINFFIYYKKYYKDVYWLMNISKISYYAMLFLVLSFLSGQLLKVIFGRNRPDSVIYSNNDFQYLFEINFSSNRGNSFPSGHTISAGSLLAFSYFFYLNNKKSKTLKYCISTFVWILIICTAISRVTMHRHFTTDVLFSILLIICSYYGSKRIVDAIARKAQKRYG